ncbi:MAG: protoporphyrinogen oxidase, partial [Myxococcales bacterium]
GPSGLAAAFRLVEAGRSGRPVEVTVFEASERPGGSIGTDEREGFRVERGADGFITDKPALIDLARRLGITSRLLRTEPTSQGALVVRDGALHPIPTGFSMMAPTRVRAFLASPLLSPLGRLRALAESALPRGPARDDESLASFVRRRFGHETLARLAQPLVGGIYGADPELLSLRSTMPRFLEAEQRSRSVMLGLRRQARAASKAAAGQASAGKAASQASAGPASAAAGRPGDASGREASGARYSLFASFDHGMQVLIDALVAALPPGVLRLASPVRSLAPDGDGALVTTAAGTDRFDRVIVALPAARTARLVEAFDPLLAQRLVRIVHGSCATVNLAFTRRQALPSVYGLVIPSAERRPSVAMTFASRKWAGRAPADGDLLRVFLGERLAEDATDERLVTLARDELRSLLGVRDEPRFAVVHRYLSAMPQYHVGHHERAAAIEARASAHPWLALAGNALHGVGLPDAVRSGERAAERALDAGSAPAAARPAPALLPVSK